MTGVIASLLAASAFVAIGFTLGWSAALRTRRLDAGLAIDLPFQTAAEVHWILPSSSVAVTGFLAAEIESASDFYIMSGAGIGVLF